MTWTQLWLSEWFVGLTHEDCTFAGLVLTTVLTHVKEHKLHASPLGGSLHYIHSGSPAVWEVVSPCLPRLFLRHGENTLQIFFRLIIALTVPFLVKLVILLTRYHSYPSNLHYVSVGRT